MVCLYICHSRIVRVNNRTRGVITITDCVVVVVYCTATIIVASCHNAYAEAEGEARHAPPPEMAQESLIQA